MNKKIIFTVIILVILTAGIVFLIEYNKYKKTQEFFEEGIQLMREGKYTEGFNKCDQMYYRKGVCYLVAFSIKLERNETITKEFCDDFPLEDKMPFWFPFNKNLEKTVLEKRNECIESIS